MNTFKLLGLVVMWKREKKEGKKILTLFSILTEKWIEI